MYTWQVSLVLTPLNFRWKTPVKYNEKVSLKVLILFKLFLRASPPSFYTNHCSYIMREICFLSWRIRSRQIQPRVSIFTPSSATGPWRIASAQLLQDPEVRCMCGKMRPFAFDMIEIRSVSHRHRGGRTGNINAWYLNTHMVYL